MDERMEYLQQNFQRFKNKKILIYGTGKIAERLITALSEFSIVGIIDRIHFEGVLYGIPILTWDDIHKDSADIIIIAALPKNYKIIYDRIQYRCVALNIAIYGENGIDLFKEYRFKEVDYTQAKYFQKNESELKKLIDQYDAISFDLFDTIIMRTTLEPADLFDLVEERIKNRGIVVPNFKKKRRTAEIKSNGGNIYQIYQNLEEILHINTKESQIILETELACEQQCLIPRKVMVEVMNYAIREGKKVSIISDMYLPSDILEEILSSLGICGYDKLYVSCEYGMGKGNGIFNIYRQDVGNVRCLHIGDDLYADVISPQRYGIDSYEIKSAYDLMKISSLRSLLCCSGNIENSVIIGLILADLFNNPFSLYQTSGFVTIDTIESFARLFIAPAVLTYIQTLVDLVMKNKYEAILFTARDGYLFKKIYEKYFMKEVKVPGIYFLTSRKLCLTSILDSEQHIRDLNKWIAGKNALNIFLEDFLQEKIWIEESEEIDVQGYLLSYSDKLKEHSAVMKDNYLKYIKKTLLNPEKKYLFCELNSSGTVHKALNKILKKELDGIYLCWTGQQNKNDLSVFALYDLKCSYHMNQRRDLLEIILTSPEPSVRAMDKNGMPVYSSEHRTEKELQMIEKAQKAIMEFVRQYVELRGTDKMIPKDLPEEVLGLCEYVKYEKEAKELICQKNVDDMSQVHINVLDNL